MKANAKSLLGVGTLAAITASLCCITPLLALLAGVGGAAATFSFLEPLHPYLTVITLGTIGLAWYQTLKPAKADACGCKTEGKKSFITSKAFVGLVTVFAVLMLTFPSYTHISSPESKQKATSLQQQSARKVEFKVEGMSCSGCEKHVESQVSRLPGVVRVKASYDKSNTVVEFDPSKVTVEDLQKSIDSTGYKAVSQKAL
jgi:mercuric ion transport protein